MRFASSATSYGYTLTVWATSAVVLHHRGIPTEAAALAFVLGAIAAFAVVASSPTAAFRV